MKAKRKYPQGWQQGADNGTGLIAWFTGLAEEFRKRAEGYNNGRYKKAYLDCAASVEAILKRHQEGK